MTIVLHNNRSRLIPKCTTNMKRARAESQYCNSHESTFSDFTTDSHRNAAGKKLWDLLVSEYAGNLCPATLVCSIAHWVTLAGGRGVEDFLDALSDFLYFLGQFSGQNEW
jgi:hypothetical protein